MVYKNIIQEIIEIAIKNYDYKNHKDAFTPYNYTTMSGKKVTIHVLELKQKPTFIKKIKEAKETVKDNAKWRVDVPSLEDLEDTKIFQTYNGCTFAIKKDGDIVNVCGKMDKNGYSLDNMEAVMDYAVNECGGAVLIVFMVIGVFIVNAVLNHENGQVLMKILVNFWVGLKEEICPNSCIYGIYR